MLLREIKIGQRFMFVDRRSSLGLLMIRGQYPATGTFQYKEVSKSGCPTLLHEETGKTITVISSEYYRSVLIII